MSDALPAILIDMLQSGAWRQPADDAVRKLVDCDPLPFDFRIAADALSVGDGLRHLLRRAGLSDQFHVDASRLGDADRPLPWIDVDRAIVIADGRVPGSDSAIVLDLRSSTMDPSVVVSDWNSVEGQCLWRLVSPAFSHFIGRLAALQACSAADGT